MALTRCKLYIFARLYICYLQSLKKKQAHTFIKPKKEEEEEETHLQNLTPLYFEYVKINDHKGSNLVFGPTIKETIYYY